MVTNMIVYLPDLAFIATPAPLIPLAAGKMDLSQEYGAWHSEYIFNNIVI